MKDLGGVSSSNDGFLLDLHGSDTVRRAGRVGTGREIVGEMIDMVGINGLWQVGEGRRGDPDHTMIGIGYIVFEVVRQIRHILDNY